MRVAAFNLTSTFILITIPGYLADPLIRRAITARGTLLYVILNNAMIRAARLQLLLLRI